MSDSNAPDAEERSALWKKLYDSTYKVWYTELLIVELLATWAFIDGIVSFAASITGAGSLVSGWALWAQPGWKTLWLVIAGIATLASLATTHFGIGRILKDLENARAAHLDLRSKYKTLLDRIDLGLPIAEAKERYFALGGLLRKADESFQPGKIIRPSAKMQRVAQGRVDRELTDYQRG